MVKNWFFLLFLARVAQWCGQLLGCLWADWAEILGGERAGVWLWMIQILLRCDKVCGSSGWKTGKNWQFSLFLAQFAQCRSRLLGRLWANLVKILGGEWARVWLWTSQILLGCDKVCRSSGWKTGKNWQFSLFLVQFAQWRSRLFGHLWANLAEILGGEWARVWLQMLRFLSWCNEIYGSSSWKSGKNWQLSPFLAHVGPTVTRHNFDILVNPTKIMSTNPDLELLFISLRPDTWHVK